MRDFSDNWFKLKKSGKPFTNVDALNNAIKSRLNSALFNGFVGN
jgi:hypothetical protein